jgi:2-polyprenyl-3-methyl-5-hydroxy-6-metoxy-1,4-benzoquinol methylase
MNLRDQMDKIYQELSTENIPWNLEEPPDLLVDAVETGKVKPCKTIDLGCGAGNYAVWLAQQDFEVTGIDISRNAIDHARTLAENKSASCHFAVADILGDMGGYRSSFDFAYDWELLHHIFPEDRPRYAQNVHNLLRPHGVYFSVCFSENDPSFGGQGKFRTTPLNTTLYFSSEEELTKLFVPLFHIIELKTIEIPGKQAPHVANVAWLKRK